MKTGGVVTCPKCGVSREVTVCGDNRCPCAGGKPWAEVWRVQGYLRSIGVEFESERVRKARRISPYEPTRLSDIGRAKR